MIAPTSEFSFRTRAVDVQRLKNEVFDVLIVGGGITGAGVAWDAASRGLKVALIEKDDFAQGTSSKSSKLIHGGLRYLENKEFHLVFEALSERAYLLKSAPHLVRPLSFLMPIYEKGPHPAWLISAGMWLYDTLSLFRAPKNHKRLSVKKIKQKYAGLETAGLRAGFEYFDASMWDDALVIDVLRRARECGAAVCSRVRAEKPTDLSERTLSEDFSSIQSQIKNGRVDDGGVDPVYRLDATDVWSNPGHRLSIAYKKLIVCAGPWTDKVLKSLDPKAEPLLAPSRGLHLVFPWERLPVPGAVVMPHPKDGRISFVIPRKDYGTGVTMVGTTDGPLTTPLDELLSDADVNAQDTAYLLDLVNAYFPAVRLRAQDILTTTMGVRPLAKPGVSSTGSGDPALSTVSREHTITTGPGGCVVVTGGKYTTFRRMAQEIVDYALKSGGISASGPSQTEGMIFDAVSPEALAALEQLVQDQRLEIPSGVRERYGYDALRLIQRPSPEKDPDGFPFFDAQIRYAVNHQMVMTADDFALRRAPVALSVPHWRERVGDRIQKIINSVLKS